MNKKGYGEYRDVVGRFGEDELGENGGADYERDAAYHDP